MKIFNNEQMFEYTIVYPYNDVLKEFLLALEKVKQM